MAPYFWSPQRLPLIIPEDVFFWAGCLGRSVTKFGDSFDHERRVSLERLKTYSMNGLSIFSSGFSLAAPPFSFCFAKGYAQASGQHRFIFWPRDSKFKNVLSHHLLMALKSLRGEVSHTATRLGSLNFEPCTRPRSSIAARKNHLRNFARRKDNASIGRSTIKDNTAISQTKTCTDRMKNIRNVLV